MKTLLISLLLGMYFLQISTVFSKKASKTVTKNYTSYRLYPYCTPSDYMRYPKSTKEVVSIVKEAISRGVKVKPFGSRHSQTDIICTEGIPVDMTKLTSCKMNSDNVTATFGSGVILWDAGEFLRQHNRSFRSTPAYGGITLGGAIGTGAHGSTIKYNSSLSAQVVKMTVVDGRGKVVVISDPEDLKAFKINLGLLGIVVDITFYTVPLYKVRAHNYVESDEVLTNGDALKWAKTTDQITIHWFPSFHEVVVANLTFVPVEKPGIAWTNAIVPSTYDNYNLIATIAKEIAMGLASSECAAASTLGYTILHVIEFLLELSLYIQVPDNVPIYTTDGLFVTNPAVGYPHKMLSPICSEEPTNILGEACIWAHGHINSNITILDNEFNLDLNLLPEFITVVKDIVKKTPTAFPLQGLYMRFSGKSDDYMSTSYGRDAVHVEFYLWNRDDPYNDPSASLAGYQTILQTLAKRFKARSHWGKSGHVYHSREMLNKKLDKNARDKFIAVMEKYDPNGIFLNNFGRRIIRKGTKIDIDPLTKRCALLDNCFCSNDSDCADSQTCTSVPGYPDYPVCETKNVVRETTCDKSTFPPPLGVLDWLLETVPTLATSVLAKCAVPKVVETVTGVTSVTSSLLGL